MRRGWASPAGQVALVGRDAELERLAAAAAAAGAGRGKIVLISGEPGIGKTAILTWLVDRAADAGARIASGAAEELELRVPFAAVSDCLGLTAVLDKPLVTGPARHTFDDRSWGRGLAVLADGDPAAAFGLLRGAWEQCAAGNREYCGHYLLPDLAALAGPLGERDTARRAAAQLERYAADRQGPALHRSASFAAAILDGDAGGLLTLADGYATAGRPLLEAQAREHAAEALAAAGRDREARLQLGAAQDHFARLGASWDASRADARLRAHGIRRGVHGERKRPKAGWAALTDTERTVATLLAEGLSNPDIAGRMFISRRTVQFHVSNILAKLGLSSRVELAALVARRAG